MGVLARVGKLALGALGVALLPNLPLDRTSVVEAQGGCYDWRLCGIYGNLCANCCGGTASIFTCPSCTTRGYSSWTSCCPTDGSACVGKMISYWDCCGGLDIEALSCKGQRCENNIVQPAWCSGGAYRCTVIVIGADCSL